MLPSQIKLKFDDIDWVAEEEVEKMALVIGLPSNRYAVATLSQCAENLRERMRRERVEDIISPSSGCND